MSLKVSKSVLKPLENFDINVQIKNTGNIIWNLDNDSKIKLLGSNFYNSQSDFDQVKPGNILNLVVKAKAPKEIGDFSQDLVFSIGSDLNLIAKNNFTFKFLVTDNLNPIGLVSAPSKFYFEPGESKRLTFTFKNNTGGSLLTSSDSKDKFSFRVMKESRISVEKLSILKSKINNLGKFDLSFILKAPFKSGDYVVYLSPQKGLKRLNKELISYKFSVVPQVDFGEVGDMRVALSIDLNNPQVSSDNNFDLFLGNKKYQEIQAGEILEINKKDNVLELKLPGGDILETSAAVRLISKNNGVMEIVNFENKPAWDSSGTLNDNMYLGNLEFRIYENNLTVINELSLENYLKGLGEVSNGDPEEKIKAIMVAARTYALYYMTIDEKFSGAPYYLNDDPSASQKYIGYGLTLRSPNIVKAVDATKGEIVVFDNQLVKTPYFNSTDGTATKSAEEVWGWIDTPYLVSVPDPLCQSDKFSGHGVGLSGCGATEAAKTGKSYKEILKYYYTGVEIILLRF